MGILGGIENALGSATQSIGNSLDQAASNFFTPQGTLPSYISSSQSGVTVSPSKMPRGYLVTLSGQDENGLKIGANQSGYITAFLPEQFDIATTSQWQPLLASDLSSILRAANANLGLAGAATLDTALLGARVVTGLTGQIPAFSQLFWTSTSPITFNLNLQFNAVIDAAAEVSDNISSLLSLTLPSFVAAIGNTNGVGVLRAPGPTIIQQSNGYNINLSIGSKWLFSNVIIEDVAATIDTLPTSDGDYISAIVHVRVSTNRIYTKQDLVQAFNNKVQNASQISSDQITQLTGLTTSGAQAVTKAVNSAVSKINALAGG